MPSLLKKAFLPLALAAAFALPAYAGQTEETPAAAAPAAAQAPDVQSAAGFAEALKNAPGPVLVEFGAPWCPYCRREKPFIEALRDKKAGQLDIYEINTDKAAQLSAQYKIRGLPTFILFSEGKPVARITGGIYGRDLDDWVAGAEAKIRLAAQPKPPAPKAGS